MVSKRKKGDFEVKRLSLEWIFKKTEKGRGKYPAYNRISLSLGTTVEEDPTAAFAIIGGTRENHIW